jgi:hypothetical protein
MKFDHYIDRYGWMIGALIILTAIVINLVQYRSVRPTRAFTLVALASGIGIGGSALLPITAPHLNGLATFRDCPGTYCNFRAVSGYGRQRSSPGVSGQ